MQHMAQHALGEGFSPRINRQTRKTKKINIIICNSKRLYKLQYSLIIKYYLRTKKR